MSVSSFGFLLGLYELFQRSFFRDSADSGSLCISGKQRARPANAFSLKFDAPVKNS
jgi:hypothetical protein